MPIIPRPSDVSDILQDTHDRCRCKWETSSVLGPKELILEHDCVPPICFDVSHQSHV